MKFNYMKKLFYVLFLLLILFSCSTSNDSNENTTIPNLTTTGPSSITAMTALSGGIISSDGGVAVIARGVVWSTSASPNITLPTKTIDGIGTGVFASSITGITPNTIYYIRAYATNSLGTAYGNQLSFTTSNSTGTTITDFDGNVYQTVTICNQNWAQSNLNVSHYRNGDVIPQVTDPVAWKTLTTGAWCYYNNNISNGSVYGKLYNWYAVNDSRGLAPVGYHIPTDAEWTTLTTCLGGENFSGGKMKEIGAAHWTNPNTSATNSSGFTGLPGGSRASLGSFSSIRIYGYSWSSTEYFTSTALERTLSYNGDNTFKSDGNKADGSSVRFLRD